MLEWLTADCWYHFLLEERHLSLVAKSLVLRGLGVTGRLVSGYSLLPPPTPPTLLCGVRVLRWWGANVLLSSCVKLPKLQWCRFSPIQRKPIWFDMIHPVSVAIRYQSDNRPFSTLHMIKIWIYKNQNRTRTAVFIFKKQPKPTANRKMETVTALTVRRDWKHQFKIPGMRITEQGNSADELGHPRTAFNFCCSFSRTSGKTTVSVLHDAQLLLNKQ